MFTPSGASYLPSRRWAAGATLRSTSARRRPHSWGQTRIATAATTDGDTWYWEVSFEDVKDSPDWSPGEEPPLAVSKAIQLAEREVDKYSATPRAYRLEQVEWLHIGNHMNDVQKWIYLVTFERQYKFEGQEFSRRGTLRIPVLLDGRVILGKKE
jgi:hypothetical protein